VTRPVTTTSAGKPVAQNGQAWYAHVMSPIDVRPARPQDTEFIRGCLTEHFTSTIVVAHDELIDATAWPTLIAWSDSVPAGLLSYRPASANPSPAPEWEVVAIAAALPGRGAGTALLDAVRERARAAGAARILLVTTNDNINALRFYQRRGFDLVRIDRGAVDRARLKKPTIPLHADGIPMRHEIELEMVLGDPV